MDKVYLTNGILVFRKKKYSCSSITITEKEKWAIEATVLGNFPVGYLKKRVTFEFRTLDGKYRVKLNDLKIKKTSNAYVTSYGSFCTVIKGKCQKVDLLKK